ncbi:hypothetical protein C1646_758016 [Rhizophagus diaphanus]|nr:hypothetical protein C1646_758016 [Rhizophagus diaphanus] [Rhizophagus sp. MUCL 43196]
MGSIYPSNVKKTKKTSKNCLEYEIPNNYKVETTLEGYSIICEINYLSNGMLLNKKTRNTGIILFSFDISCLIEARKTILIRPINCKNSFTILTSHSQQNKRINLLAKDIEKESKIILKQQNFDNTKIQYIKFEIGDEIVGIDLSEVNLDFIRVRQDAVICACDKALISRDGYRHLAAISSNLEREYQISNRRNKISKYMEIIIPIYNCKIELDSI